MNIANAQHYMVTNHIVVNAQPGQSPKEIAAAVVEEITKTAQVGFGRTPMGVHQSEAWSLTR